MEKKDKKDGLFKIIARFFKYNLKAVFVVIFFICLISFAVFGNKGLLQRIKLESEKKDIETQLENEFKKTKELQTEIEELKSSDTKLEKVAREKYGMTKDGEKIYKIIIDTTK